MVGVSTEASVGILEYLNNENNGFNGRIKERFSDFNVTEIDLEGNLVSLGSANSALGEEECLEDQKKIFELEFPDLQEEDKIISEETFENLKKLRHGEIDKVDVSVAKMSKEERKLVHSIAKRFELTSETVTNESQEKIIRVIKSTGKKGKGDIVRGQRGRSKQEKFLHFSLYKENYSTGECISCIARGARSKDRFFSFAGTKDKRGRTLQRIAVSLIKPQTVEAAVSKMRGVVSVGNYTYHPQGLRLGDLKGNRFDIAIKDIDISEQDIRPIMDKFIADGFINYFGMQRFGTSEISTHKIGLAILKKDFSTAIDLILAPREHQYNSLRSVLEKYKVDQDAGTAFKSLDSRLQYCLEGKLLKGLTTSHANDKTSALRFIPSGTRQMYGHAYQSFIWNSVVSRRIKKYGTQVLEGDLVENKDDTGHRLAVKHLDNPASYSILDVYIPLPGHSVKLPKNETTEYMMELLKEDGLDLTSFRNLTREYDLPGDYRQIIVKGADVTWRVVTHSSLEDDLIHSKLELKSAEDGAPLRKIGDENGSMKSLILGISLSSSCYATMALREIMKVETDIKSLKTADTEIDDSIEANDDDISSKSAGNLEENAAESEGNKNGRSAEKHELMADEDTDSPTKKLKHV